MNALTVKNLHKEYPAFTLDNVSFSVGEGRVCGLIGANGAGKTTTLKGIMGLIKTTGEAEAFGVSLRENEAKKKIGYVGGGFRYYPQKTVSQIARVTARFYPAWREEKFKNYLAQYSIDERKKISALSDGMKVKFFLALALSHGAKLLILDEPTSGLDPLSREEFCDTILESVCAEGVSVLYSTHITSDLEKIADDVVFLSQGKVLANRTLKSLLNSYVLAHFSEEGCGKKAGALGLKRVKEGFEGLLERGKTPLNAKTAEATLDDIMIHLEIEGRN